MKIALPQSPVLSSPFCHVVNVLLRMHEIMLSEQTKGQLCVNPIIKIPCTDLYHQSMEKFHIFLLATI